MAKITSCSLDTIHSACVARRGSRRHGWGGGSRVACGEGVRGSESRHKQLKSPKDASCWDVCRKLRSGQKTFINEKPRIWSSGEGASFFINILTFLIRYLLFLNLATHIFVNFPSSVHVFISKQPAPLLPASFTLSLTTATCRVSRLRAKATSSPIFNTSVQPQVSSHSCHFHIAVKYKSVLETVTYNKNNIKQHYCTEAVSFLKYYQTQGSPLTCSYLSSC